MTRLHHDPRLAASGHRYGDALDPSSLRRPVKRSPQDVWPELVDKLPTVRFKHCYGAEILIPANTAFGAEDDGLAAWYGLERIRVDEDTGEQVSVVGVDIEAAPADVDAAGTSPNGATVVGWGDVRGSGARIIVGKNLPIRRKAWTVGRAFVPGVSVETASPCLDSPRDPAEYICAKGFPTGKYSDPQPNRLFYSRSYLPTQYPFTEGTTLDVALVLRRSQLATLAAGVWSSGAAQKAVIADVYIQLALMKTVRDALWNR